MLAGMIALVGSRIDASSCLVRVHKIEKLALGGPRSIDVHLDSVVVKNGELIQDELVLLLDDVTKTGNSLMACRKLLLDGGAKAVQCAALGQVG